MMNQRINYRPILIALWIAAIMGPVLMIGLSNRYFLNYYAIGSLAASYFIGILGIAIAGKRFEEPARLSLFLLSLCFFFWLWTAGIGGLCRPSQTSLATVWFKIGNLAVVVIATQTYVFTTQFLRIQRKALIAVGYSIAIGFAVLNLGTNYFVQDVHHYSWGFYPRWRIPFCIPFFLYFAIYLTLSLVEYFRARQRFQSQHMKNQINYLLFAFGISYLGSVDYLPALGFNIYPFGYIAVMGWWTILAIAILKHRLMDITIIIRKTLIYAVVTGTLTCVYLVTVTLFTRIFEGLTGYQTIFSSAVAAGLITLCFQPLRKKVQSFVDSKFFRQYVDREEKLYELSREVITHTTPEAMAQSLIRVLADTLHPKSAALYLRSRDGSGFVLISKQKSNDLPSLMLENNPLTDYFADHPQPFVKQDLPSETGEPLDTRRPSRKEDAA